MSYISKTTTNSTFNRLEVGGCLHSVVSQSLTSGSFAYLIVSGISNIKTDMSQEYDVSRHPPRSAPLLALLSFLSLTLPSPIIRLVLFLGLTQRKSIICTQRKVFSLEGDSRREYRAYLLRCTAFIWGMTNYMLCTVLTQTRLILLASEKQSKAKVISLNPI